MDSVSTNLGHKDIPTYGLGDPERNPLFFEKRVYQGSSGKVYPLPFIDKVYQDNPPQPVAYQTATLENQFVRLEMLPEIGGRIFIGQDKTNNDYDFFYRQDVIKPALVGLAGPWISGGVEFNWPQHHRPGTYLPADVSIENLADGSSIVWMSEHDPLNRLKGMHGICLRPGSALVELKGRLYNRTAMTHTFLWWANVAAMVHDNFQSFFPPDVHYVADHAVRAMSSFPLAEKDYYGVNYGGRPGANDLSWYKNIPVPTSYMVCQTEFSFFGGYDYDAQGGFIHVANKHISPGKKQWTWGNHEFGWAWDRELTDENGPYVELMAGVYTDNQPDFTYLLPYETKRFSQFWWPYQKLGPVQEANQLAAIRLVVTNDRKIEMGLAVTKPMEDLHILLKDHDRTLVDTKVNASPDAPWIGDPIEFEGENPSSLCMWVINASGEAVIGYRPVDRESLEATRELATEPSMPEEIETNEELYLTGEHLELYRHPTRYAETYWNECLKRDPLDVRSNIALGRKKLQQGLFAEAETHFNTAIQRLTRRHPNPETGQAHYFLGLALRYQEQYEVAYTAFYKATWNYEWKGAAYFELACLDMRKSDWDTALDHLEHSLETLALNNKAQVAKAICLRKKGMEQEALEVLQNLLKRDTLDHWALAEKSGMEQGVPKLACLSRNDAQTALDIAFDYASCGCYSEAALVLEQHHAQSVTPVAVPNPLERTQLTHYTLAWALAKAGEAERATSILSYARSLSADYCFPSRLEEQLVLQWALGQNPTDRNAAYGLGNYCFDRKRHQHAISIWEIAASADPSFATVHRNLGIAYWNQHRDGDKAREFYLKALSCDPEDSRLIVEYSQLCEKLGDTPSSRLQFLESHFTKVQERDDACVELATLYNLTDQSQKAVDLLCSRSYHPWEGGEGKVLRQFTTAHLLLGKQALHQGVADKALQWFESAMDTPDRLGEKYHLLQAKADVVYWQGMALKALGRTAEANAKFAAAANESGDFQSMEVKQFSVLSFYKALALRELGDFKTAESVFKGMIDYANAEMKKPAKIEYFATSLPHLLVFDDDTQKLRDKDLILIKAYALQGMGNGESASASFEQAQQLGNPGVDAMYLVDLLQG